jgi:hypothetical protein
MKKIFFLTSCFIFCLLLAVQAQEGSTKIKIKVKDVDGKLIEKEYNSEEAFRNDPELKALGIDVEAENGRVMVRSQGDGNRTVIVQQGSSEGGNSSYLFQGDGATFPGDSLPPHPRQHAFANRWKERGEVDSLRKEKRVEIFAIRDSLHEARRQFREEHREEMMKRREEMRARREELRQQMQEMDVETEEGTRIIIIQELSKKETGELNNKKEGLELNELRFYPNPGEGALQLELEAKESGPVEIKLIEANTRKVVYESTQNMQAGEGFKENISLESYQPGWYRLQISQNNKMLNRKVIIK